MTIEVIPSFPLTQVPLQAIANQSFTITLENNFYQISLKETNGVMSSSIKRNDVLIQSNSRLTSGYFLIPYKYQQSGNFFILTDNGDYPYYTKFGITQYLIYITQAELDFIQSEDINFPIIYPDNLLYERT